ncbi:hypothetical protein VP1G_11027 [Cytospora mali]|uniref:Uncharacterized protein n=1 Tax=Cytospora mali TaxID=578113 RepID=A0A194V6Y4_CYTMA|nr:hypothetical protein VP1G_11027 [Valsa mali var. pyri (nom. inval.)]
MAYYSGSPDSTPGDTVVVDTSYNSTTDVTFTAVLRPEVAQGEWADTGYDGHVSFICWGTS